jgi:hypothetical protein
MKVLSRLSRGALLALLSLLFLPSTHAAIIVYDLRVDFSNVNNPNGTWRYYKGNTLLTHYTPVTQPTLSLAAANGYWGDSSTSNNSAIMLTTANGSATGLFSDTDFLVDHVLVRTTDPSTGGPMIMTWTAPTAGSFTYNGFLWYAGGPLGPGGNSFTLSLNNGPAFEMGSAALGQDMPNATGMVNGATPISVLAGDVVALELNPLPGPSGSLAGVSFTIDFTPVPEVGSLSLAALGVGGFCFYYVRRGRRTSRA